jgi:four helix bundle protein
LARRVRTGSAIGVCRFEDLRVWQAAREQSNRVGELLKRPVFRNDRELSDQMNAASLSVMFNISEGFLRRRDKETAGRNYTTREETVESIALNESIGRMLRRWEGTLDLGPWTKDQGRTKDRGRTKHQAPSTKDHE